MVKNEQIILTILAALVGLLGGGAAIVFREGIALVQSLAFGFDSEYVFSLASKLPWWHILLATTGGGLASGAEPGRLAACASVAAGTGNVWRTLQCFTTLAAAMATFLTSYSFRPSMLGASNPSSCRAGSKTARCGHGSITTDTVP